MISSNTFFLTLAFLSLISLSAIQHVIAQMTPPTEGWCPVAIKQGYACQEYTVTTDDGYILSIQRILGGRAGAGGNGTQPRQPVLLQHGLSVDGMTWMFNAPGQSLAFVLADNGYDVWISNIRGTKFSRRHVTLNALEPIYWNWSWEDIAEHDIIAVIGLVFKQTGQKMHYVGHSMGTTVAFVLLAQGKFQNIKSAALLCPIAHMGHVYNRMGLAAANFFGNPGLGMSEYDPKGPLGNAFLRAACATQDCSNMTNVLFGIDCCVSPTAASNFLFNYPQSSSLKNLAHFSQIIVTGRFAKFDYGIGNMARYGALMPPEYNLAGIATDFPIFIGAGGKDDLSVPADVAILVNGDLKTHNPDKLQVVNLPQYSHADFIMASNAYQLVYTHILDFFQKNN